MKVSNLQPQPGAGQQSEDKTVTVIVPAHGSEFIFDTPEAAALTLNAAFFSLMAERHVKLKAIDEYAHVYLAGAPTQWFPKGIEDESCFTNPELVITHDSFWFRDEPKHTTEFVECESQNTAELKAAFDSAEDGQTVLVGSDKFKEEFMEFAEEHLPEIAAAVTPAVA